LNKANEVWFLNQDDKLFFEKIRIIKPEKSFILNGEGVNTDHFLLEPIPRNKISFILIARILFDKGVKEYFEAAKKLKKIYPDVSFKILGYLKSDNPMAISEEIFTKWINTGAIEYAGFTEDIRPFLKESTCVVLPSYREGISVALMEGASMGRPLIASDIPGCKELIDESKTGFLCRIKDVEDLAAQMEKIINMEYLELEKMGKLSRQKMVDNFSIQKVLPKYEKVLESIS
jgi:glycosyltransferase involved in cell wall biosynthesis